MVPGHEGMEISVQGTTCDAAGEVIDGAVGEGRNAYEAAGFSCEPEVAGEGNGDTNYRCTGDDDASITFLYGAA